MTDTDAEKMEAAGFKRTPDGWLRRGLPEIRAFNDGQGPVVQIMNPAIGPYLLTSASSCQCNAIDAHVRVETLKAAQRRRETVRRELAEYDAIVAALEAEP